MTSEAAAGPGASAPSAAGAAGGILVPRLTQSWRSRLFIVLGLALIVIVPTNVGSTYWLTVLNGVGVAAIAAVGLNVLTGYAGQLSLGQSFFVGIGAFSAQYFGGSLDLPMVLWLPLAGLLAAAAGGAVAPFALRLRGPYLAIVSLSLVFLGIYIARNIPSVTGGYNGTVVEATATLGPIDFERPTIGGLSFSREQGMFLLTWSVLAVVLLLVANIMRTRAGRAMQASRDHDIAAEVLGVRMLRTQVNAFVVASGIGGIAGALLAVNLEYIRPENFDVALAVQYLAIIVIGGLGTLFGPVLGALFVGLVPVLVDEISGSLPFMSEAGSDGLSTTDLTLILYGSLIVLFLTLEPRGLVQILRRTSVWLRSRRSPR
ncbi:MAG: branched-chain amino acid ABC transporter permease [Frankia sp.]|nr:branched-chain amino acid ABC transporter permease [Frankia sp.]